MKGGRGIAVLALLLAVAPHSVAAAPGAAPSPLPAPVGDSSAPASEGDLTGLSQRLSGRVATALRDPCLASARTAVSVRDLASGFALVGRGLDLPLAPASNQKILTGAACLAILGPEYQVRTLVRADHAPDAHGDVGVVYLVGGGDPGLDVEGLYAMARAVAALGVRTASGIVADDSFFAGPGRPPTWPTRNFTAWYSAPSSALSANYNVVAVHAASPKGGPAMAWLDPFPEAFEFSSSLRAGRGSWSIRSEAQDPAVTLRSQRLSVSGSLAPGRSARELRAVEDPALFAAHGFAESLARVGVIATGSIVRGVAPPDTVLLHARPSQPVAVLVRSMDKVSSNVFAEVLVRLLGAQVHGSPGTREKGLAVLAAFLAEASPRSATTCRLEDGLGLSPENRLTVSALTDVLVTGARDHATWPELLSSLPIGGVDGTLARRLSGGLAERNVRAKTGRINSAVALSGVARVDGARDAAFSVLVNDFTCPSWKVQDAVDAVVLAVVSEAPAVKVRLDVKSLRKSWQDPLPMEAIGASDDEQQEAAPEDTGDGGR